MREGTPETDLRKAAVETEHADAAAENAENELAEAAAGDAEFTCVHVYQHVLNGDRNSYCTTYE